MSLITYSLLSLLLFVGVVFGQESTCQDEFCSSDQFNKTCCCGNEICPEAAFNYYNKIGLNTATLLAHFNLANVFESNGRMLIVTVPRLNAIVLINAVRLCPFTWKQLRDLEMELGMKVRYIISPRDWHWLFLHEYIGVFPEANIYIAPGRIQEKDPDAAQYKLIDVNNPLPELYPEIQIIPFNGIVQPPPNNTDHRNEFYFYISDSKTLFTGDTLWYWSCQPSPTEAQLFNATRGEITFHFLGMNMVFNKRAAFHSAESILALDFTTFVSAHGVLGNIILPSAVMPPAKSFVQKAFTRLFGQPV